MDHTVVTLQTHHTRLYLVAFTRWRHQCSDSNHLISAYSFINSKYQDYMIMPYIYRKNRQKCFLTRKPGPISAPEKNHDTILVYGTRSDAINSGNWSLKSTPVSLSRKSWAQSKSNLFMWIDVDVALDAFLTGVGPAVSRHPLSLTPRTLVLAETAFLALVRRHRFWPRSRRHTLRCNEYLYFTK